MKTFFSSFATKYWVVNSFIYLKVTGKFLQTLKLGIFVAKQIFHKYENRINWENGIVYEKKKFLNLITLLLLIKQQNRNFAFISQVFSNQYYSFENNTPSHSRRYGDKTNAAVVIAAVHNLYLISVTSDRI